MTEERDEFQEDYLFQLPSILDQINIEEISPDDEDSDLFIQPDYAGHDENLAESLKDSVLTKIASSLINDIENDIEARKDWEDGLTEGLLQLGLKIDKKTEPFEHACGSYSPIVMQTVIEFYVSAVPELLPEEGPVKQLIVGTVSKELQKTAERAETWSNLYFTKEAPEFYPDFKKMLMWLGVAGNAVRKTYFDPILKRPTSQFLLPQDFIVKYGTTNLETCRRMTERKKLDKIEVASYQKLGIYRNIDITADDEEDDSSLKKTIDTVDGTTVPNYDDPDVYTIYESHVYLDIEDVNGNNDTSTQENENLEDTNYKPYIVSIDRKSRKILGLYRNWEEGDKDFRRVDVFTNYSYMEGLYFYGYGAAHLIAGMSDASTKLLRQTIDGQTLSNFPGGLRSKDMRASHNNLRIGPTEFVEVDTGGQPIRDGIMLMPYKEPSPYLNELRKELEAAGSRIMGAANSLVSDFNPNVPVGTTYAMLGLLYKVQSTVIRGIRDSMTKEFGLFYKLFAKHLPDEEFEFDASGSSSFIKSSDFSDKISIIPVADPHVTSEIQKLMRSQVVVDNATQAPDLHDRYIAYKMYYEAMKMPKSRIDELLPKKEEVIPLDPITENQNLIQAKPARASLEQDHQSHLVVHGVLLNDPNSSPEIIASVMAHNAEHLAFKFLLDMQQIGGFQMPENPYELPIEVQNQIAMMVAQALMQQQQQQQEDAPPPPLDPALVMLEEVKVKDKGIDEKSKSDQLKAQTEAFKAQLDYEAEMKKIELDERELDLKEQGII